ncbi:hypothetical protein KRR40_35430 [Niabella defluvii]|nr:hypothetical protein KRR40_35430 [Niabella sp. I65]
MGSWPLAVEFRSACWYNENTYQLLDNYKASLVFHDKKAVNRHNPNWMQIIFTCAFTDPRVIIKAAMIPAGYMNMPVT